MSTPLSCILGVSGLALTLSERDFLRDCNPWGVILFARNVDNPDQIRRLTDAICRATARQTLIFIDQEGGRVQRMKAPHWRAYPSGDQYSEIFRRAPKNGLRAAYLGYRLIADDLREVGVTANCAPVLDLPQKGADPIISDRALGRSVDDITDLAHAVMAGLMCGGVAPVIKHIPGHGRATVDSHKALPVIETDLAVLEDTDFAPFRRFAEAPMAMTAHAVYKGAVYKGGASLPITLSQVALTDIIRKRIGFDGLVMSDDLDMKALKGSLKAKTERALSAGCDIALQCSGVLQDSIKVARGAKTLSGRALERSIVAQNCAGRREAFDRQASEVEFETLLRGADFEVNA